MADEIAYNTADLDDSFFAELFPVEELARVIPVFGELAEQVDTQFPGAPGPVRFWEVQRQVMNFLIGGLIDGTLQAADGPVSRLSKMCVRSIFAWPSSRPNRPKSIVN